MSLTPILTELSTIYGNQTIAAQLSTVTFILCISTTSGVARGGFGEFKPPIEKCSKNSEDNIVENTQS